jgi:formylglycine-generating enzyme required for sulfatase activity
MGGNPSYFKGPKNPVEQVSWDDCQGFLEKVNAKVGGWKFSLPTEAQWEYACRAGSTTRYFFGEDDEHLGKYAWYDKNSDKTTHPVGEKKPNAWGLYDMHGNVFEWCQDWGYPYLANSPTDDPAGPSLGAAGRVRVMRGGSWFQPDFICPSAFRSMRNSKFRHNLLGLRLARVAGGARPSGARARGVGD